MYSLNVINVTNLTKAEAELTKIGCERLGIDIMATKAVFKVIKFTGIRTKAANILKQTFLSKGADAAVSRNTADLSDELTDVLVMGTIKQYRQAIAQLKLQPWGLKRVAADLERVLQLGVEPAKREYHWADRSLSVEPRRSLIMGILNVTPDSFSDGGRYNNFDAALARLEQMQREGADIIDIGAESTRPYPGRQTVPAELECERLLPLLDKLVPHCDVPISIDTYKARVAKEALKAGAHIINDIWGLQYDGDMAKVVAEYDVPVVVMHNRAETNYPDGVMQDINIFLQRSIAIGIENGIKYENIIVDPGIGFAKTTADNLQIMANLEGLLQFGCPVLLGASRKRFIGEVLGTNVDERVEGTLAATAQGKAKGVNIHRVHDVRAVKRLLTMLDAMMEE